MEECSKQLAFFHHQNQLSLSERGNSDGRKQKKLAFLIMLCVLIAFSQFLSATLRTGNESAGEIQKDKPPKKTLPHSGSVTPGVAHFYCLCATADKCGVACDTSITFNDPTAPYDMPGSTWTTARNGMYLLAKDRIRQARLSGSAGATERYFCFMDGDIQFSLDAKQQFMERLSEETEWMKIVSPVCPWSPLASDQDLMETNSTRYVFWNDAMLNCFEERSMDMYLPFRSALDSQSWWMSQLDLIWRANIVEPLPFKVYTGNGIRMENPEHSPYPNGLSPAEEMRDIYFAGFDPACCPLDLSPLLGINCTYQGRPVYSVDFRNVSYAVLV